MRATRVIPVLALVLALHAPPHAAIAAADRRVAVLPFVAPLGRVAALLARPFRETPLPVDAQRLEHDAGWRSLRFPLDGDGDGVYLAVTGTACFELAYVDLADGTQDRLELSQTRRHDGLFALVEYPATRRIVRVSLLARAITPEANVAVRLGR